MLLFGCSLICVITVFAAVLYAYHLSNPRIDIPTINRERFADVVVLLDGTGSVTDQSFASGKEVVVKGIIPSFGIGDRLATYSIGPEFGLENVISGGTFHEQPPQLNPQRRAEALDILRQSRSGNSPGRVRTKLYELADQAKQSEASLDKVRSHWAAQITAMRRPTKPGTNISCALDAIDAYFQSNSSPDEERWLFVVSDLIEEHVSTALCSSNQESLFPKTRIVFLYPHDSRHDWRKIIESWRHVLGDRQIDVYPLSAALNKPFVLPPNPLSGLQDHTVRGFWDNLRSLVSPAG